ncbi:hypothetical protein ACIA49_03485 [Kribbella sp. NPDC051587]|uniref:hypothetical protein n=1 Tax=Kribbella sp. NPDC051587 TaxID=3364119 RepID=UPI0037B7B581
MAHRQRLRLTLRNRNNDREWKHQPVEVTEDPDDHDALLKHLEAMARDLDRRGSGDPWWIDQYELRVQGLDQAWRDFRIVGRPT